MERGEFGIDTATQLVNEYHDALDHGEVVVEIGAQWQCTLSTGLHT